MSIQRHYTVSVFIVCKNKVLLHLHKKYGILLPLGGHIETNELPEEACIREAPLRAYLKLNKESVKMNVILYSKVVEFLIFAPLK